MYSKLTYYKGVKFRSILERNWAMIFDFYKIKWEYEKESHFVESGNYTIDFNLPGRNTHIEVKGHHAKEGISMRKTRAFAIQFSQVIKASEAGFFYCIDEYGQDCDSYLVFDKYMGYYFCTDPNGYDSFMIGERQETPTVIAKNKIIDYERIIDILSGGIQEEEIDKYRQKERKQIGLSDYESSKNYITIIDQDAADRAAVSITNDMRCCDKWHNLREWLSGPKVLMGWPDSQEIKKLSTQYPNFIEVCEFIMEKIICSKYKLNSCIDFPPLLLIGNPACGKSSFSCELAEILVKSEYRKIDLGQTISSFSITGNDMGFINACEGDVIRLFIGKENGNGIANPVLILDEIDKCSLDRYNPLNAILSILEKRDAEKFIDNFVKFPIDASNLNVIMLGNSLNNISKPLISRSEIFLIKDYSEKEMKNVVIQNIFSKWKEGFNKQIIPKRLPKAIVDLVFSEAGNEPRKIHNLLEKHVEKIIDLEKWCAITEIK